MSDKIIYTKKLGKNIVNVVLDHVSNMLHIVVATPIGQGEYVGKTVGKPFKIEDEEKAIKLVDTIHNKWKSIYNERKTQICVDLKGNLKTFALNSSKTLCNN